RRRGAAGGAGGRRRAVGVRLVVGVRCRAGAAGARVGRGEAGRRAVRSGARRREAGTAGTGLPGRAVGVGAVRPGGAAERRLRAGRRPSGVRRRAGRHAGAGERRCAGARLRTGAAGVRHRAAGRAIGTGRREVRVALRARAGEALRPGGAAQRRLLGPGRAAERLLRTGRRARERRLLRPGGRERGSAGAGGGRTGVRRPRVGRVLAGETGGVGTGEACGGGARRVRPALGAAGTGDGAAGLLGGPLLLLIGAALLLVEPLLLFGLLLLLLGPLAGLLLGLVALRLLLLRALVGELAEAFARAAGEAGGAALLPGLVGLGGAPAAERGELRVVGVEHRGARRRLPAGARAGAD